jgi:hypothetical protein
MSDTLYILSFLAMIIILGVAVSFIVAWGIGK